ncbi:putative max-like protein X [Apostichopus japonicus]|uniref:Max-like protein X n=1 Tax=Stichopus japonicus TaxID=307972 RepID=A0A2G8L253_STIJA|nr:putative max-like protein X [Apostichopus japonicus]
MEEAFRNILPNCTLYPFGSTVNTFGKRSCDIDMYLDRGTEAGMVPISQGKAGYKLTYDRLAAHSERVAAQTTLSTLASFLRNHVPHCGYVIRILNATCPLVKFKHRATGLSCDLTGDNSLALKSSELLYIYGQLDPRVRPLIFLVRSPSVVVTMNQLSKLAEDTESQPVIGNGCKLVSDLNKVPPSANEENLEQLLREFFQFLCSFSFQRQGVSVRRGEPFPNIDENVPLHIENPLETDLNTSKNVSQKLLTLMQTHAKDALKMMEDPTFQKSDDGNIPWGLPLMFLLPSHMERGSNKSMGLGNRLTNILKGSSPANHSCTVLYSTRSCTCVRLASKMSNIDSSFGDSSLEHSFDQSFGDGDTPTTPQTLSRQNSGAGIGSSNQSMHLTDDDDDPDAVRSYRDKRRNAHTQAEQKRRDAIKRGYDELQEIVPTCSTVDAVGSQRPSKATILQRSIDYIQYLVQQKKKQEDEVEALRKEVMALKIMKTNYEQIVKAHQNTPGQGQNHLSDQIKFNVFKATMDSLFQTFNATISVASFTELSACVFSWLEEYCKPQTLRELVIDVLRKLNNNQLL